MHMFQMLPEQIESMADEASLRTLNWLVDHKYLTEGQREELHVRRLHFLYKRLPWYTRAWKKIWPASEKDDYGLVIVQLPAFEEEADG